MNLLAERNIFSVNFTHVKSFTPPAVYCGLFNIDLLPVRTYGMVFEGY